jgi:hypothetical protein
MPGKNPCPIGLSSRLDRTSHSLFMGRSWQIRARRRCITYTTIYPDLAAWPALLRGLVTAITRTEQRTMADIWRIEDRSQPVGLSSCCSGKSNDMPSLPQEKNPPALGLSGFTAALENRTDQSPPIKPRRSRTHRPFLTHAPLRRRPFMHYRPAPFRFGIRNVRSLRLNFQPMSRHGVGISTSHYRIDWCAN